MDPLFAVLPEGFEELSREEIQALIDERLGIVDKILENKTDPTQHTEFIGERSGAQVMEELTAGVEDIEKLKDALKAKAEAEAEYAAGVEALAARAREGLEAEAEVEPEAEEGTEVPADGTEAEVEGDGTGEVLPALEAEIEEPTPNEPEVVEEPSEPEVVTAAAVSRPMPPKASPDHRPLSETPTGVGVLRASAGFPGVTAGQMMDRGSLTAALIEAHEINEARDGARVKTIVASARITPDKSRDLSTGTPDMIWDKIQKVTAPQVIRASGGFCAPYEPRYDLPILATAARPVKAALASFFASRGGITFPTPLSLASVEEGVGIVTNEDDELGGTFGAKSCVVIDCDPFQSADVDAVYACVTHGNLNARAWPERVANVADLLSAQHAKVAETNLLNGLSLGSTAVADDQKYGAVSTMLEGIIKAAAAYRSRHRMDPEDRLRAILPAHVIDLLIADMVHGQFDRFKARAFIAQILSGAGINVSFYLDSADGAGQIYGAQDAGALLGFLSTIVWYLFSEGTWLFLDFGRLDLGIVRDSILNEQNDFQVFMETFEGIAMVGIESLEVTSTVCSDGTYAPTATAECG
jgi:hypothetical protein